MGCSTSKAIGKDTNGKTNGDLWKMRVTRGEFDHGVTHEQWASLLREVDLDNNGEISKDEWMEFFGDMDGFAEADANGDGVVDLEEWGTFGPRFCVMNNISSRMGDLLESSILPEGPDAPTSGNQDDPQFQKVKFAKAAKQKAIQQAAGHAHVFFPGSRPGRIIKRTNTLEADSYELFKPGDSAFQFFPTFYSRFKSEDEKDDFVEIQNLLTHPQSCVMDIKVGGRTFLEKEVTKSELRVDLAAKMKLHGKPLTHEQETQGITKLEYMLFREALGSVSTMQFRIEGYSTWSEKTQEPVATEKKVCAKLQSQEDVVKHLHNFLSGATPQAQAKMKDDLLKITQVIPTSQFFKDHEVVGGSLLFVYVPGDADQTEAMVKFIDFGKTVPRNPGITHTEKWVDGNHEDEILPGIANVLDCWSIAMGLPGRKDTDCRICPSDSCQIQ
jgi:1D-myo-inositol-triphosphate 3-kinase